MPARKRPYIKPRRKKEERAKIRYSTDQPPIKPTCGHNTKAYQCSKLNSNDVLFFNRAFYATNDKIKQDNFNLKYVISTAIIRRRPKIGNKPGRLMALKYFIRKKINRALIPVCKKAFLGILNLKKGRLDGVAKRHYVTGSIAVENRGGDKKMHAYRSRKEAVEKQDVCSTCLQLREEITVEKKGSEKIRLMADGCGGQNKNSILLSALMNWLYMNTQNIKSIEIIFPVTGHSFLPPDRVFALTEKQIRKMETILLPEDYMDVLKEHATVLRLGTDIPIFDFKTQSRNVLKSTQSFHFQITKCKRFIITLHRGAVKIRGEMSYYSDTGVAKTINKRGQSFEKLNPEMLLNGVPVNEAKLIDVRKLLETHFGQIGPRCRN
ncbi:hypothetical protein HW555_008285 [Spodoptera exigua]|uniref:DUF7869 domain-containing protein n=1 Tax=Spodoptera exigua TaxID=7107 RepID=A0A835L1W4_SPOEX|nr:hypothetical protein HW555_008285 [Spodoptera exigua]